MICAHGFGLRLLLEVILYRLLSFGSTLAVGRVERCPLLRGSKCTIISIGRAIGGMEFVRCTRGCWPFGESINRGFTVLLCYHPCPVVASFHALWS